MRTLTASQKKLLKSFIDDRTHKKDSIYRSESVFSEGRHNLDADDLTTEIWGTLQKINDTEILYQNVNRFMNDYCSKIDSI